MEGIGAIVAIGAVLLLVLAWKFIFHPIKTTKGILRAAFKIIIFLSVFGLLGLILKATGEM